MCRIMAWAMVLGMSVTAYAFPAMAQTVSVLNGLGERGHGFLFERGGTCYAAMPRHVAGPFPRVTLSTAAPVVSGTATVLTPFWDGIDLALAVVREGLADRCTSTLDDLDPSPQARTASRAQLLRLSDGGAEERSGLSIEDRSYLTFSGIIDAGETEITQGTSGAFAFADGQPIGMAIASDNPERAIFMRSEEISLNIGRFLSERAGGLRINSAAPSSDGDAAGAGLPLVIVSSSVAPINPLHAPENMLVEGEFVFAPSRHTRFDFRFEPEGIRSVSRLRIVSPKDGEYAIPKTILVQTAVDQAGQRFRSWMRGEMGPDGIFDTGQMADRNARRVRVQILDFWRAGPAAIARVRAD